MTPRDRGSLRARVHRQLDPTSRRRGLSIGNYVLIGAILAATLCAILETEPLVARGHGEAFDAVELVFGVIFLAEYVARLWSASENPSYAGRWGRVRYALGPAALFDLAAVAATLVPALGVTAMPLRLVRVLRILRLAKLGRLSRAMGLLRQAVWSRRDELALTGMLACFVLVMSATVLYWIEGDVQPEKLGSIPRAMWWAAITLTTIGYGDVSPVTPAGKVVATLVAVSGIALIAVPTGILASAFSDAMQNAKRTRDGSADGEREEDRRPCD